MRTIFPKASTPVQLHARHHGATFRKRPFPSVAQYAVARILHLTVGSSHKEIGGLSSKEKLLEYKDRNK